ncbi:MAG: hypothetical protein HGB12_01075, partial [Bacteroidetes bacterium]|nr:hypothetical protein [Bacteroidota bacterium]
MNKSVSFIKKTVKVILWVLISFLLLFIIIAVLIQIPAIQTKIVKYATSLISSKTNTKVEIKNISISFPKSVVIEGLYLEDTKKDTLLYAGRAKVNIAFKDLFNNEIHINSLALDEVNLNLSRTETDSLFNYNFLLTAFSDTTKQIKVEPEKKSKWTFSIDNVSLKSIQLLYNDDYDGMNVAANLKYLNLKMDQIDFEKSIYSIDELLIEKLNANVLIKKSGKVQEPKSAGVLPKIKANNIRINNSNISYGNSVNKQSLIANINSFQLSYASIDLEKQIVTLNNIALAKSNIHFRENETVSSDTAVSAKNIPSEKSDWKISVTSIDLDDNSLAYIVANKPEKKNVFDASHLDYKHLTLAANNFYYSSDKTEVSIKKFTTIDQNNFSITKFETDFIMDQYSITAKNLKIKTSVSSIDADFNLKYSSLKTLIDSIQFLKVYVNMKSVSINNYDILYFDPDLKNQVFFKNVVNNTNLSGVINGTINNLNGNNLQIHTGANTSLQTDFNITGLPDFKTA